MDMTSYFRSGCFDFEKKFGSLMQNNMQISGKWSKSQPKVDFQYGGRLFFKNGSSCISAINWDMSTKFGLLIDFDLLKAAISTNAKPEIVLSGRGRQLDKAIWRPNRSNTISGFASIDIAEDWKRSFSTVHTAPNNTLYNDYIMRPRSYSRGLRNRNKLC